LAAVRLLEPRADFAAPVARDFAFAAAGREAFALAALERVEPDLRPPVLARDVAFRAVVAFFRVPLLFLALPRVERDAEPLVELGFSSIVHLPDMTRCAASATASAMIEPSLVALDITLLAACEAVSAASSPASRILRLAAGLALIAAAAAARPAASISLLIAALVSRSKVSFELDEEPEELFVVDLAIACLPAFGERHFNAVTVPK
jgi:hypothetical protein